MIMKCISCKNQSGFKVEKTTVDGYLYPLFAIVCKSCGAVVSFKETKHHGAMLERIINFFKMDEKKE